MTTKTRREIIEKLKRRGFDLSIEEFFQMTLGKLLRKYGIKEPLTASDYYWVMEEILEVCGGNDYGGNKVFYWKP